MPVSDHPNARRLAFMLLKRYPGSSLTLNRQMDALLKRYPGLDRREKALFKSIIYGVFRWRLKLDTIIDSFAKTPVTKMNPDIAAILRIGLYQILYLTRVPDSAAVNTSVEMTKRTGHGRAAGFVNAILRKAARQSVKGPDPRKDPVGFLCFEKSYPRWLVERWLDRFGSGTASLLDAGNRIPDITLRVNSLKTDRESLCRDLAGYCNILSKTGYSPLGIRISSPEIPFEQIPAFKRGYFQVQDEAAQLVSIMLDPRPGETILDACCGLGGKTGHIHQMLKGRGRIIALDSNGIKLKKVRREMNRLGSDIVIPKKFDLLTPLPDSMKGMDRILLDAPCTGLGVIRRNPDAKWRKTPEDITEKSELQLKMLENVSRGVKPGGVIVYSVCSMEPEETINLVKRFLLTHEDFVLDPPKGGLLPADVIDDSGCLATYPHVHGTDGFFAARIKRLV